MHAQTYRKKRQGGGEYLYPRYICSSYKEKNSRSKCGHFAVDARLLTRWLVWAFQTAFLGPGRDKLVEEIRRQLQDKAGATGGDVDRLEKRLGKLDKEVSNLVKAVRVVPDVDELVAELAKARSERDRVRRLLARETKSPTTGDIDQQAEEIADRVWNLGEALSTADPSTLREVFQQAVSKIECRFKRVKGGSKNTCHLVGGRVSLRDDELFNWLFPRNGTYGPR